MAKQALISLVLLAAAAGGPAQIRRSFRVAGTAPAGTHVQLYSGNQGRAVQAWKDGTFEFKEVSAGSYVIRPQLDGCTFSPPERNITITNADLTGIAFLARCPQPPAPREAPDPGEGKKKN